MSITVNGKALKTDAAGFLVNPNDWSEEVADALVTEHEKAGHKPLNETARGLIGFFREHYEEN